MRGFSSSNLAFFSSLLLSFIFTSQFIFQFPNSAVQAQEDVPVHVKARLIADTKAVSPNKPLRLAVELEMDPGWHTYYKEPGEAGMPTKIEWLLPPGFKAGDLLWQKPEKLVDAGIVTYGYSGKTIIASELSTNLKNIGEKKLHFGAKVKWLSCKESCVPGSAQIFLDLPVDNGNGLSSPDNQELFKSVGFKGSLLELSKEKKNSVLDKSYELTEQKQTNLSFFTYLVFAFIGGLILNFMPCVLPVISIKIFSLIQQAGDDPKKIIQHGITFMAGIILSFLALAILVISIQNAGQKIGWGFQFQYPVFVLFMATIITIFALSMFGVFYFQFTLGQAKIDKLASSEGLVGTFFKGVLATFLSTPCTAPFLGTALGFAFAQPWWQILLIFFVISLGMSFPYLLLTLRPKWMKYLPKPGDWMERFKESMGFLLLGTVVWLLWVLANQVGIDAAMSSLGFLLCLSVAVWMLGTFVDLSSSTKRRAVVWLASIILLGFSIKIFLLPFPDLLSIQAASSRNLKNEIDTKNSTKVGITWENFSVEKLDGLINSGKTVFVDFTADWCLTCKANEQTVINTEVVANKMKDLSVVTLKADWTSQNSEITSLLAKFGRSGVPLYVIFPAKSPDKPIVLPEIVNTQIVLDALEKAGASSP